MRETVIGQCGKLAIRRSISRRSLILPSLRVSMARLVGHVPFMTVTS